MMARGAVSLPPCYPGLEHGVPTPPSAIDAKAPIIGLLRRSCPPTIRWHVAHIIVNAVYAVLERWPQPHICKEILKIEPPVANCDASPAIVLVCSNGRREAPTLHRCPNPILGCSHASMFFLSKQAPATFSNAALDVGTYCIKQIAAIAGAFIDVLVPRGYSSRAQNLDPVVSIPAQVLVCWHDSIIHRATQRLW